MDKTLDTEVVQVHLSFKLTHLFVGWGWVGYSPVAPSCGYT